MQQTGNCELNKIGFCVYHQFSLKILHLLLGSSTSCDFHLRAVHSGLSKPVSNRFVQPLQQNSSLRSFATTLVLTLVFVLVLWNNIIF